ncbi:MAG: hypothetical protein IT355_15670 [Gemmatimonadaceae bacterium]|nr:hypothetical protein [Gemmatimonadaceae bacterium]
MSLASHAIFPAPPASGADLVDRHWAVDAMPASLRLATIAAAGSATVPLADPALREAAHTLATAYELAALLGRDALRSGSPAATATLERAALAVGAERANLLHRALGPFAGADAKGTLRHAVRLCALAAVAGPTCIALTRTWLRSDPVAQRLEQAERETQGAQHQAARAAAKLWIIWRQLLLHPDPAQLEQLVADLAALREQRSGVTDLSPSTNEAELRLRFQDFVRERLADAAGLLAIGLRGRTDPHAVALELSAQCTAARSASTGDPNLDLLAAWLELAALTTLAPQLRIPR